MPDEFISDETKQLINEKTGKANAQKGEIYNDYTSNTAGIYAHAEGLETTASGDVSHAEGENTTALGYDSHAEGANTTSSGKASHTEGENTTASGRMSHAEGVDTTASGKASHAEGSWNFAVGEYQHVQGYSNLIDTNNGTETGTPRNKYLHIVGNGTSNSRSNAHTIDWDGVGWYKGSLCVGGLDMDTPDAELTPNSVVIKSSTAGSIKRFRITVDDSGTISATEVV